MAQELEAWNLHALHASPLELYALSAARRGSSTTGIGGTPFLAGEGSRRRRAFATAMEDARSTSCTAFMARRKKERERAGGWSVWLRTPRRFEVRSA